jgi:hypothetical protein
MDLPEFLLARIAEDEAAAHAASPGPWTYGDIESVAGGTIYDPTVAIANVDWDVEPVDERIRRFRPEEQADATGRHIARHDPAQVLADCAAKRALIDLAFQVAAQIDGEWGCGHGADQIRQGLCSVMPVDDLPELRILAQPFAGHPDFDSAWR